MSEIRNNTFSMLVDEENHNSHDSPTKGLAVDVGNENPPSPMKSADSNDDANWTIQQNTRSRRLAPAWNLSKHDLGAENISRSKLSGSDQQASSSSTYLSTSTNPANSTFHQIQKKKVQRFSREELLVLRKRTAILSTMAQYPDIVSTLPLDPILLKPLDADEVTRLWNADKQQKDGGNRLKGKSKKDDDEYGRGNDNEIWDDNGGTLDMMSFDLTDIAAAALKFQSDTLNLSTLKDTSMFPAAEEPPIDHEDEEVPEWARDDNQYIESSEVHVDKSSKRSMLLEALQIQPPASDKSHQNIEPEPESTAAAPDDIFQQTIAGSHMQQQASRINEPEPLAQFFQTTVTSYPDEWYYTDPQGSVQGPFSSENMKAWNDAGYFSPELPVKMKHWQTFHQLLVIFPIYPEAFQTQPAEPISNAHVASREQMMLEEQQQRMLHAQALEQQHMREQAMMEHNMRIQQQRQQQQQAAMIEQQQRELLAIEARKQQEVAEENRRKEQQLREQQQRNMQQAHAMAQAQAQAQAYAEDKRRAEQQMYMEAEKQRLYLESRRQHENNISDEVKYHEQLAYEKQRRQLEEQQQYQRQQEGLFLEEQRRKLHQKKLEDQRQEELRKYQDDQQLRLQQEKHHLEQQQQRQKEYIDEQRRQRDAYEHAVNHPPQVPKATIAPWAAQTQSMNEEAKSREYFLEIQRREEAEARINREREAAAHREMMSKGAGWGKPVAASNATAKSLLDIQLEEQRQREAELHANRLSNINVSSASQSNGGSMSTQLKSLLGVQGKNASSGWTSGSANAAGGSGSMTLREIMEQEQVTQANQVDSGVRVLQSGSWAAKASTSSPAPYLPVKHIATAQPTVAKKQEQEQVKSIWTAPVKPASSQMNQSNVSQQDNEVPRELVEWCESNLKKINPRVDTSLMQICYTFESAGDIREYVSQLLGSTPQASHFATEFIRRKESLGSQGSTAQMKRKKK